MYTDSEKLKNFREEKCLSQAAIAKILGVAQTSVAMIENGTRTPSAGFKLAFLKAYGVDWDTFVIKDSISNVVKFLNNHNTPTVIPIPFYSAKAAAGLGEVLPDYPEKDVIYFDKRYLQAVVGHNPDHLSLIRAEGDSMLPDIQDGDLLMIDDSIKEIIPNKTFVIMQDNKLRVKKLKADFNGDILIISNNPAYPNEVMNKETTIIGQVVWNGSKESL